MKYMDVPQLNQLSRLLSYESSECIVHTRIEAYSLKTVARDKKLWKALEKGYAEDQMEVNVALFGKEGAERDRSQSIDIGPPRRSSSFTNRQNSSLSNSPADPPMLKRSEFSPTDHGTDNENEDGSSYRLPGELDRSERKTLFVLKSTLNSAFPHHDFSSLGAEQFTREKNGTAVLSSLSNTFRSVGLQSSSDGGRSRGGGAGGRGGFSSGLSRATTYSAYPSEGHVVSSTTSSSRTEGMDIMKELERRQAKGYEAEILRVTHPVLFGVLDDAIGLKQDQYEVYVWTPPNAETDPHGSGGDVDSDGEWPEGSSDEGEGDDSEDEVFLQGSETESEGEHDEGQGTFFYPGRVSIRSLPKERGPGRETTSLRHTESLPIAGTRQGRAGLLFQEQQAPSRGLHSSRSPTRSRLRLRGSLLWSNHWFLVNRKMKRVLFISIHAKSRGYGLSPSSLREGTGGGIKTGSEGPWSASVGSERFVGWSGASGAGARAFAARKAGSSVF